MLKELGQRIKPHYYIANAFPIQEKYGGNRKLSEKRGKQVLSQGRRAYNKSMPPNGKGANAMEFDIDDLIFGDTDPGPSGR
ncbi:MAG: hypothetical protein IKO83_04785 [Oscillospiraceae bacterium]|nr:hypothetical protein [Oscillospiraceae bacterium]